MSTPASAKEGRASNGIFFRLAAALLQPGTIGKFVLWASKPKPGGVIGLTREQAQWMQSLMAENRAAPMRGAAHGLVIFDSRPWLKEIRAPTLVVGGTHDFGVPRHYFDMLVNGIPGAVGRLVERAGHTLVWTHKQEFAEIIRRS